MSINQLNLCSTLPQPRRNCSWSCQCCTARCACALTSRCCDGSLSRGCSTEDQPKEPGQEEKPNVLDVQRLKAVETRQVAAQAQEPLQHIARARKRIRRGTRSTGKLEDNKGHSDEHSIGSCWLQAWLQEGTMYNKEYMEGILWKTNIESYKRAIHK